MLNPRIKIESTKDYDTTGKVWVDYVIILTYNDCDIPIQYITVDWVAKSFEVEVDITMNPIVCLVGVDKLQLKSLPKVEKQLKKLGAKIKDHKVWSNTKSNELKGVR